MAGSWEYCYTSDNDILQNLERVVTKLLYSDPHRIQFVTFVSAHVLFLDVERYLLIRRDLQSFPE